MPTKTNPSIENKEWEIEFERLANHLHCGDCERGEPVCGGIWEREDRPKLKSFIRTELAKQREEMVEKIEKAEMIAVSPSGEPPYRIEWVDKNKLINSLKEEK